MNTRQHRDEVSVVTAVCVWAAVATLMTSFFVWAVERPGSPLDEANYALAIVLAVAGAVLAVIAAVLHLAHCLDRRHTA